MRALIRGWMAVGHFGAGLLTPMLGVGMLRLLTKPGRRGEGREPDGLFARVVDTFRAITPVLVALSGWFMLLTVCLGTGGMIALAASGKLTPPADAKPPAPNPLVNAGIMLAQAAFVMVATPAPAATPAWRKSRRFTADPRVELPGLRLDVRTIADSPSSGVGRAWSDTPLGNRAEPPPARSARCRRARPGPVTDPTRGRSSPSPPRRELRR